MVSDEQLIEYLDGTLSQEDRGLVAEALAGDARLQQRYENLLLAKDTVRLYGIQQQVAAIRKKREQEIYLHSKPAKVVSITRTVRVVIAVAASLLILFAGVKGLQIYQLSSQKIYAQTFIDFPVTASRSAPVSATLIENAYRKKDYRLVIELSKEHEVSTKERLLTGIAYLQLQQPNAAIILFRQLQKAPGSYQQDIEFYLGLAYLQGKNYRDALPLLRLISQSPQHFYHQQVTEKTVRDVEWLRRKS